MWVADRFKTSAEAAWWGAIHHRLVHVIPWVGAEKVER